MACPEAQMAALRERTMARRIRSLAWVASATAVLSVVLAPVAG